MKKISTLFFVIIIVIISIVSIGCSNTSEQVENDHSAPNEDIVEQSYQLETVTNSGVLNQTVAGSENGFYQLKYNNDGSANILYYDIYTMQLIDLSNQLLVTEDETNPGWLESISGGAAPFVANNKLYVINLGYPPVSGTDFKGIPAFIIQMDLNGANKLKLEMNDYIFVDSSAIVSDGKYLYFMTYKLNQQGEVDYAALCKADFENSKTTEIIQFSSENRVVNIMGVYQDQLMFYEYLLPEDDGKLNFDERYSSMKIKYFSYSLSNKSKEYLYEFNNGDINEVVDNEILYFFTPNSSVLKQRNLFTGEINEIYDFKQINGENYDSFRLYSIVTDQHVFVLLGLDGENYEAAINIETKEISEFGIFGDPKNVFSRKLIFGDNDNYYFVQTDIINYLNKEDFDGAIIETPMELSVYSLISKDDYYSCDANFLEFTDNVFTRTVEVYDPAVVFGNNDGNQQ